MHGRLFLNFGHVNVVRLYVPPARSVMPTIFKKKAPTSSHDLYEPNGRMPASIRGLPLFANGSRKLGTIGNRNLLTSSVRSYPQTRCWRCLTRCSGTGSRVSAATCPSHLFHPSQKPWNFASPPDTLSGMHKIIEIFADRAALHTEILALRQQVAVLKRKRPRPMLRKADRVFWVILSCLWPGWRHALVIVRPETVIGWHRKGFRLFWTWKSQRGKPGRPPVSREIRDLVRRMSRENTRWGAPRIHGELLKLGFSISQAAVSKYMARYHTPAETQNGAERLRVTGAGGSIGHGGTLARARAAAHMHPLKAARCANRAAWHDVTGSGNNMPRGVPPVCAAGAVRRRPVMPPAATSAPGARPNAQEKRRRM